MRLVQHKKEAYWFYRFLSIFYDKLVNPLFWTIPMREKSLDLVDWSDPALQVVDVGSGTGFTTEGIVTRVPANQVTCMDQSPHQMKQAKKKAELSDCTFLLGDAENLPFPDNRFDCYVSAGSIEYWPHPDRGIREAIRVIKPGGQALMIGPLQPRHPLGRRLANTWMLFPTEAEYRKWYQEAGFSNIQVEYIRPHWFSGSSEYGLAIVGRKPLDYNPLPVHHPVVQESETDGPMTLRRRLQLIWRVAIGSLAGFFFIPAALLGYLRAAIQGKSGAELEKLNRYQVTALLVIAILIILLIRWIL
mgnify:CR=1 FL=1